MPPTSVTIFDEGAEIVSFKIVSDGVFDSKGLHERMIDVPARYPGSSGCRNIRDVESDLKAVSPISGSKTGPDVDTRVRPAASRGEPQGHPADPAECVV